MPTARQAGIRPRERVNNGKNAGDDGQKVLLAIKSMGGESAEAWRSVLDDLTRRGLRRPEFLIVDGAAGLDSAIVAVSARFQLRKRCLIDRPQSAA